MEVSGGWGGGGQNKNKLSKPWNQSLILLMTRTTWKLQCARVTSITSAVVFSWRQCDLLDSV